METVVKEFVQLCARRLQIEEPIVELGSMQVEGQEGFADLRPFFPGKQYIGCDFRSGRGVDQVEDIRSLSFPDGSVGTVLMMETLEHLEDPFTGLAEAHRILRPGGLFVISSVMDFNIHGYPSDFWRFTPYGFEVLMKAFPCRVADFAGVPIKPRNILGAALKGASTPAFDALVLELAQRHLTLAERLQQEKQMLDAAGHLQRVADLYPQKSEFRLASAECFVLSGYVNIALREIEAGLSGAAPLAHRLRLLSLGYIAQQSRGRESAALDYLERIKELDPKSPLLSDLKAMDLRPADSRRSSVSVG